MNTKLSEKYAKLEEYILNLKIPWYVKMGDCFWFYFGKYFLTLTFIFEFFLFMFYIFYTENKNIYNTADTLWFWMKLIFFIDFFGIAIFMLISHLIKEHFVKKQAKKMNVSVYDWNYYVKKLRKKTC